ncbi:hypothetical protein BSKO_02533 [Bryopsis sp. KO-2023]|nr:hypothetical protein BSKO_02533 [Bryopsis sp. KO-2023]
MAEKGKGRGKKQKTETLVEKRKSVGAKKGRTAKNENGEQEVDGNTAMGAVLMTDGEKRLKTKRGGGQTQQKRYSHLNLFQLIVKGKK